MAVYNVSSAREFIEAFERCDTGDTIEVQSNLDWNDVIDDVSQTIKMNNGAAVSDVTINGNNHNFYNLTAGRISTGGSGKVIFQIGSASASVSNVKINNLSFLNCQMGATVTRILMGFGGITIYNSVIQGRFKSCMFYGNFTVKDSMMTCAVIDNGRPLTTGSATTSPHWTYCWFSFKNCTYIFTSTSDHFATNLDGCYVEGQIGLVDSPDDPRVFINTNNSCINVLTYISAPTPDNFVKSVSTSYGQSPNIINIDKINAPTPLTEADSTTWVKCVTDAHMKDAEYLASVGFDIVS